jgi:hypothetical protein
VADLERAVAVVTKPKSDPKSGAKAELTPKTDSKPTSRPSLT